MRASSMEDSVRDAARVFARQIGSLSADPAVRDHLLKTAVREMSWRLFNELGDHYRLAQQLQTMAELAWLGAAALRAAEMGSTSEASEHVSSDASVEIRRLG